MRLASATPASSRSSSTVYSVPTGTMAPKGQAEEHEQKQKLEKFLDEVCTNPHIYEYS